MKQLTAYLRLIRSTNLLIIIFTQYFLRHFIILPIYNFEGIQPPTGPLFFLFLVLSTVCIAAAGYAINDYFDMRVDRINKPDKMILGKIIPRRMAILIHGIGTGLGILFSFIAAFMIGEWKLGVISIIIAYGLWQYSHKFKASYITGNFVIALFSAFVVFIVWLFEIYAQINSTTILIKNKTFFDAFIMAYLFFAFITSFIREIIKDIEDIEGDRRVGCKTIPIQLGIKKAKLITYVLSLINIIFLITIAVKAYSYPSLKLLTYYMLFLVVLYMYEIFLIFKAKEKPDFSYISMFIKIIMFAGVLTMQLIYILIK